MKTRFSAKDLFFIFIILSSSYSTSDSFIYNSYNNHGVVGLINTPTARFFDDAVHGVTVWDGDPPQKITLTSNPFEWLEASFFYTNIQDKPYCDILTDVLCQQDYKDKGFNVKLRIKEQGALPAIAVGVNDIAGTGLFSSEYIVSSYGIKNIDIHFGLGWGTLNGSSNKIKNPFGYINDEFNIRPSNVADQGGQFQVSRYFSSEEVSPFYGIAYAFNDKLTFKIENDPTLAPSSVGYEKSKSDYSFGFEFRINDNFSVGVASERGNYIGFKFIYRNNPESSYKAYEYKKSNKIQDNDDKYTKLIKNLESNGIGVNRILETSESIGLELTQFIHPSYKTIESIIKSSTKESGIRKNIKKDIRIADLKAVNEIDKNFESNSTIIYERIRERSFNTSTGFKFRPFIASREEFFKGALLLENDSEYNFTDYFSITSNIKYSVANNFEDLRYPPFNTFPAQVRSDIKQYLKNMDEGLLIGRLQADYRITPKPNHHFLFSGGILEDMFSGIGFEYLYFRQDTNYAFGIESFKVRKRDYEWGFGHLDYENTTLTANMYYRNYGLIPFDMKISAGEYLAGDIGTTIEFSRSYSNGVKFGVFATFTDVSTEQFGEGSFDKGIFWNIPIAGNAIAYTWRPLTKDPGSKLVRKNTLHDLLIRFRPIN